MKNSIIILDFGSQYTQIIARRIREINVYSIVLPYYTDLNKIKNLQPLGIILSGSPSSVNDVKPFLVKKDLFQFGIPILGICYGMQLITYLFEGEVSKGKTREYGKSEFHIKSESELFNNIPNKFNVWMSHFDSVIKLPKNFEIIGTSNSLIAAFQNINNKIYGLQFHPEVYHCEFGSLILKNFVLLICKSLQNWFLKSFITDSIKKISKKVEKKSVILAFSGGIDSAVALVLLYKAIGKQLIPIFINNGLLRKSNFIKIIKFYKKYFQIEVKIINASSKFLKNLIGIQDPEKKRKKIGQDFIEIFNQEAKKNSSIKFLAQGTIYSDIIESKSKEFSKKIKSHHNVGGLPKNIGLTIIEPLKDLFKDEVRKIGLELGIPYDLIYRHPFPGPGFGIRIIGEISVKKIKILEQADSILIEELFNYKLYYHVNQAFVVLLPLKSVGVMGDERTYEYTAVIRAINSSDFMTANWSKLPYDFLEKISYRIINEVKGINRVVYDISSKPPATIEWE